MMLSCCTYNVICSAAEYYAGRRECSHRPKVLCFNLSPPVSSLPMDVIERFQAIRLASLAPDLSDKAADSKALPQDIGFVERSPLDSPSPPWSTSSLADSSVEESPQMSRAQRITNVSLSPNRLHVLTRNFSIRSLSCLQLFAKLNTKLTCGVPH